MMAIAATALTVWNGVAHADGGARAQPEPSLLSVHPLTVPIVDHGEVMGRLHLRLMWKASDAGALTVAEGRAPRLRALLLAAAADHARLRANPSQPVDPAELAASLGQATRKAGFSGELLVLEAVARGG